MKVSVVLDVSARPNLRMNIFTLIQLGNLIGYHGEKKIFLLVS